MATSATEPLIGINALAYYIKRIYAFLESEKKTLSFPKISQELQDVLVKITTENIEFLLGAEFTSHVQFEATKLAAAIKTNGNIKLTYEIQNGTVGTNILMYKKIQNTFKVPEPLRKPSVMKAASLMEPPSDGSVTQMFKTNCLNAATKFVKDDSQLVMRFPEMAPAQAEFVMDMMLPGKEGKLEKTDLGYGYRSVYAPLWESMRLFSLKYKYKIEYDTRPVTKCGMKRVIFEKIPKSKSTEIIETDSAGASEIIITSDTADTLDDSFSTSSSTVSLNDSKLFNNSKKKTQRENKPDYKKKVGKLIRKLSLQMQRGQIEELFIHDALKRISEFLMDDQQKSIVFEATSQPEQFFLSNVKRLSSKYETYMLFSSECQKFLDNVKYCINKKNVQYNINYAKGVIRSENGSLKTLQFEKTSSKASDITKTLANSSFSSESATSVNASSGSKKEKIKQGKMDKVVARLLGKLRNGSITEEYIETVLRRISEFMNDKQQASVVFQPIDVHHLKFIQKAGFFAREEGTYRTFTNESRKLLQNINSCFKRNILYHVRQFKGGSRRDVILEKLASFDSNYEENSSLSSVSTTSVHTTTSAASLKKSRKRLNETRIKKKAQKVINQLYVKMRTGVLEEDFIQGALQRIADFMYDEQGSLMFQNLNPDQQRFITHVETIARDETWHSVFRNHSRKLLADLNGCFKRNMLYDIRPLKGRNVLVLEKLGKSRTKERMTETENNENVNNTNTINTPTLQTASPLSELEQDVLIRLKAIKETVVRTCGEQAITDYLQDISKFLTLANIDRSITFDDLTESEALFLKHVHMLSKLEPGYAMFSRDCRKLLKSIKFNAQSFKLKFQMNVDVKKENLWSVIIEKQYISPNGKKEEQHRARSLSAGRRTQQKQSTANLKVEATTRGASTQRLTVKEKLKAALAQPVHSEKAVRMMECMGWKGGALGPRGEGIMEPIELPLDLVNRAGLGHVPEPKNPKPVSKHRKSRPPKHEAPPSSSQLPQGFRPVDSLPSDVLPPGILPRGSVGKCKTVVLKQDYHVTVLRSILEIITTDVDAMHFVCMKSPKKIMGFLNHAVSSFNGNYRFELSDEIQKQLVAEISHTYDNYREIELNVDIRNKTELYPPIVVVKKTKLIPLLRKKKINDEEISLIDDGQVTTDTEKPTENDQPSKINKVDTITTKDPSTESTMIWYEEPMNDQASKTIIEQESTTHKDSTTDNQQLTRTSGRQWYFKLKSKRQHKVTTETRETTKNHIRELKILALSAVCKLEGIDTDVEKPKITARNDQTKTDRMTDLSDKNSSIKRKTLKPQEVKTTKKETLKPQAVKTTKKETLKPQAVKTTNKETLKPQEVKTTKKETLQPQEVKTTNKETLKPQEVKTTKKETLKPQEVKTTNKETLKPQEVKTTKKETLKPQEVKTTNKETLKPQEVKTTNKETLKPQEVKTTNKETLKPQEVKTTKKSKPIVKIPTMTRKLRSISNQQSTATDIGRQRTTHKIEKETYKMNKINNTNVKDNKNSPEMYSCAPKKMKITNNQVQQETRNTPEQELTTNRKQTQQESETKKPPGVLLLEKLTINNNYSTINQNSPVTVKKEKVKAKPSVSVRLENAVANSNITVKKEIEPNSTPAINNVAPIMNNNALTINNRASDIVSPTSSDKSDTGIICKRIRNMNIVVDKSPMATKNTDLSVTYIIPVESKMTVVNDNITETMQNIRDISEENNSVSKENCNKHITETKNLNQNDLYDEYDECQIVFDSTSSTVIDSEDEDILLITDDEIETKKITNSLMMGKGKVTSEEIKAMDNNKKILKEKDTSRKLIKAIKTTKIVDAADEIENVSDNYYDSEENLLNKPALIQIRGRKRPSLDYPKSPPKKRKLLKDFKKICILPTDYPRTKMDSEKACEIQTAILKSIDYTQESLPLLKCQDIQNGGLIYSCQDEKSLFFLENLIQSMDDLKIVYEFDVEEQLSYKMAFRIISFIEEPVDNVLNRLELYNTGLNSTKWTVFKQEQCGDFAVIYIGVDEASFNYVCEANFILYAGNDCARFTIVWD